MKSNSLDGGQFIKNSTSSNPGLIMKNRKHSVTLPQSQLSIFSRLDKCLVPIGTKMWDTTKVPTTLQRARRLLCENCWKVKWLKQIKFSSEPEKGTSPLGVQKNLPWNSQNSNFNGCCNHISQQTWSMGSFLRWSKKYPETVRETQSHSP